MHDTALAIGKKFFEVYARKDWKCIIETGAMDINGSLRSVGPPDVTYIGVDIEHGKSVDIKVDLGEPLPFRDDFADCMLSSSQFEHDDFFWMTFLEMARVIKPGGLIYISSPSNGYYHRHPNDNWRFYPDCGHVLVRWANKHGYDLALEESFIADRDRAVWNDFVAVFSKSREPAHPRRFMADGVACRNVWKRGAAAIERASRKVEDQTMLEALKEENKALKRQIEEMTQTAAAKPLPENPVPQP